MAGAGGLVQNTELRKKIIFTLGILAVFRIGVSVPTPGVNGHAVMEFFAAQKAGVFGLFNTFTGGALEKFSIFALGIMPYISSSIIFQLLTSVVPALESLKKEGSHGQKKISQYTRYGTIVLAVIQGYGISTFLLNNQFQGVPLVESAFVGPFPFRLMTIITLTAGTCFVMWLGEQITERGIGNGASLIIFAGIAADMPKSAVNLWSLMQSKQMLPMLAFLLLVFMILVVGFIIFLETCQRRIPIQYSQQRGTGRQTNHLPLKLNFSGVIPPIFASSLLMFPATIAQFSQAPWAQALQQYFTLQGSLYNVVFSSLIIFFCFFYVQVVFNPTEVADNLKKWGGFVPGIRAGKSTSDYIMKVLERITVGGAIYLAALCVLPSILVQFAKVPFYFGGTSLLIMVGVALDTAQQIQTHMLSQKYEGFMKHVKVRSRRVQY